MHNKTNTKAQRRLQLKKNAKIGWVFIVIGMLAFIAFVYSGREYNVTVIPFRYLLLGSLVMGVTVGTLILKYRQRTDGAGFSVWRHYLWASIVYGSLAGGLFFWTNINCSRSEPYRIKARILKKLETVKYHHLYLRVNIDEMEKDVPMPNVEQSAVARANFVVLTLKSGFWGFPFIVDRELCEN